MTHPQQRLKPAHRILYSPQSPSYQKDNSTFQVAHHITSAGASLDSSFLPPPHLFQHPNTGRWRLLVPSSSSQLQATAPCGLFYRSCMGGCPLFSLSRLIHVFTQWPGCGVSQLCSNTSPTTWHFISLVKELMSLLWLSQGLCGLLH